MTLDQAIKRAEEVMIENLKKIKGRNASDPIAINCFECAEEYRQLTEWLKDYKRLLEQESCDLLIIKSDKYLHPDDRKKWMEKIKREKESGVIILSPCFELLLVPNDNEIRIEQEQNGDAISRQAVLDTIGNVPDHDDGMVWEALSHAQRDVALLPPVRPQERTGHWIRISPAGIYECSECGQNVMTSDICAYKFCHGCGAKMADPQESEVE